MVMQFFYSLLILFVFNCNALLRRDHTEIVSSNRDPVQASDSQLHQCLSDKRIVLIGDSTIRYEYLTLAYFAEYGVWPGSEVVKYGPTSEFQGPPLWEGDIPNNIQATFATGSGCMASDASWSAFYEYTNALFNGHEACDCYRKDWEWSGHPAENMTENRMYSKKEQGISMSYFQWHGTERPPQGTCIVGDYPQCQSGQFRGAFEWKMPTADFISYIAQLVSPTHIIVDSGWWPVGDAAFFKELAEAGAKVASTTNLYWRKTPRGNGKSAGPPSDAADLEVFKSNGWKIYDARSFMSELQGTRADTEMFIQGESHIEPAWYANLGQYAASALLCDSSSK